MVCILCGNVVFERVLDIVEWNNYVNKIFNLRCGLSIKIIEINLFRNEIISYMFKGVKNVCIVNGKMVKYDILRLYI